MPFIAKLSSSAWAAGEPVEWSLGAEHQEVDADEIATALAEAKELELVASGQRPGLVYKFYQSTGADSPFAVATYAHGGPRPGSGRPRLPPKRRLTIRIGASLAAKLEAAAAGRGITTSDLAAEAINQYLKEDA